jgi:D-arabinose 1-dehydrogenase-like Zn-dependent alcohol dehydrogenase
MMRGDFALLPEHMSGHEGLGQVVAKGSNIQDVLVGDIVATRGEPAYADEYCVKSREYVEVPECHPRYIIEPVACGINCVTQNLKLIESKQGGRLLILGSGFLAWCAYNYIQTTGLNFDITVVGRSNRDIWGDLLQDAAQGTYDVVIDLSSGTDVFEQPILNNQALIVLGSQKTVTTDFGNLLWKACSIVFPSPRTDNFYFAMVTAVELIKMGYLNVDKFWTRGYNRNDEWQQAFEDAANRPLNYSRGYIKWP